MKKLTDLHWHELLHGTSLVSRMLDEAWDYESGLLAIQQYPELARAYERAADALQDLYQAVGQPGPARKNGEPLDE